MPAYVAVILLATLEIAGVTHQPVGCVQRTTRQMVGSARSRILENACRCSGPVRNAPSRQAFRASPTLRDRPIARRNRVVEAEAENPRS